MNLIQEISKIVKTYNRQCKNTFAEHRLTLNDVRLLIYMIDNPEIDVAADISRNLSMAQSLICRSIESLSKKGLLEVKQDKNDRRLNHLALTVDDSLKHQLTEFDENFKETMIEGISISELGSFESTLKLILSNLSIKFKGGGIL